jgi:hypothetical protein
MKNLEESLQGEIERGEFNEINDDGFAYKMVFEALKKEPEFHVSLPFADRIISKIEKKEEQRIFRWMWFGIFCCVIAAGVAIALTDSMWSTGVFTFLSSYSGLVIFAVAFILLLQWVDKKVINKQLKLH